MKGNKTLSTMLLTTIFILTSCKQGVVKNLTACEFDPKDENTRKCEIPEPAEGEKTLKYVFKELKGFNQEQDIKIREVLKRVKIVINSEEFKQKVLNHEFQGEKTFVDNAGLTNEQIYKKIMDGEEMLIPGVNHTMDLSLTMYYTNNSTVGYTYPNTTMVWMNAKFFNSYTYGQAGANVVHEWTHKLGFEHSYYNDYARPYSVPYAVGTIIEDLIDSM